MSTYSQAILAGLKSKGFSPAKIRDAGRIPAAVLTAVSKGKHEFTFGQLSKIERLSGFTGGQLAAIVSEPHGGPLTDLLNGWAKVHQLTEAYSARSRTKRRGKTPRRKLVHARAS
jgi:hypothetical protein